MQDKRKEYFSFLSDAYKRHINSGISWGDLTNEFNELLGTINRLNVLREEYLDTGDKEVWRNMIELLPQSYNQKRTVQLNYQVLKNIYKSRKGHKLDEWQTFREWCETLPYFVEICGE